MAVCRAGARVSKPRNSRAERARTSGEVARKIKTKLVPPQSPRSFSALAHLYYLARPTKTAMLRRLQHCWTTGIILRAVLISPILETLYVMSETQVTSLLLTLNLTNSQESHLIDSFISRSSKNKVCERESKTITGQSFHRASSRLLYFSLLSILTNT